MGTLKGVHQRDWRAGKSRVDAADSVDSVEKSARQAPAQAHVNPRRAFGNVAVYC